MRRLRAGGARAARDLPRAREPPSARFIAKRARARLLARHRIVSITPALAGQDLGAILADLFSVERLIGSHGRHDRRAAAVALVSAVEQFCRLVVSDMLGRGKGALPAYVEIPLASVGPAAHLSREDLVSFSYNFQNVPTIENMLAEYGMRDVLGDDPQLRGALAALFAARNEFVHTSVPVGFDARAAYDAVVRLVFGIAVHVPELEAEMRLVQGDTFIGMRMPGRSRAAYKEAEALCRELVRRHPESAEAHARLGLALYGLGRHEEAIASYDRAISLDPGRAAAHIDRALPLAGLGRHEEAIASCGRAAEIDPSLPDPHLVVADILAGMDRPAEALAACGRAAGLDGSLPRTHLVRGGILADMDCTDEALAAYDKSIELDEYNEGVHVRRADLLAAAGRIDEALAAYDAAIEIDPRYAEAHFRKAVLLDSAGHYDDALCCHNLAIEFDPNHTGAHAARSEVLSRLGRGDEAVDSRKTARRPGR